MGILIISRDLVKSDCLGQTALLQCVWPKYETSLLKFVYSRSFWYFTSFIIPPGSFRCVATYKSDTLSIHSLSVNGKLLHAVRVRKVAYHPCDTHCPDIVCNTYALHINRYIIHIHFYPPNCIWLWIFESSGSLFHLSIYISTYSGALLMITEITPIHSTILFSK